jgi:hypothetical protein
MESIGYSGEGMIVIGDDDELDWTKEVLAATQRFTVDSGFFVQKMMSKVHQYHLDDAPDLRSCNIMVRSLSNVVAPEKSEPINDAQRLLNFYGRGTVPHVKYVRERKRLDYGKAHEDEYELELLESKK